METLGDIRLFVEAASMGSLSAAGRKLSLTPAAASARLNKLEEVLKAQLFERTTRQLRLTEEGRLYLEHCTQALQALEDGHAALQLGQNVVRGKLRVSATSDLGRNLLSLWLDEFNDSYPELSLALILSDGLSDMLRDDIDVAIRVGLLPDSSLIARRLADNRRMLVASPAFVQRYGEPREPHDLARFPCIVHGAGAAACEWRFMRGAEEQVFVAPAEKVRETNDGAVAREWAIRGRGITLKSVWDVAADLREGRLLALLPAWQTPEAPLNALYHRNRYLTPRLRVLLDFLSLKFASPPELHTAPCA